mmetsp:Transcript_99253/g.285143  ORF Transcript_99253/g.285143 Transcript_99253/m.285143 type:complete len:240 (+) Transcript_99253:1664-2383(+)
MLENAAARHIPSGGGGDLRQLLEVLGVGPELIHRELEEVVVVREEDEAGRPPAHHWYAPLRARRHQGDGEDAGKLRHLVLDRLDDICHGGIANHGHALLEEEADALEDALVLDLAHDVSHVLQVVLVALLLQPPHVALGAPEGLAAICVPIGERRCEVTNKDLPPLHIRVRQHEYGQLQVRLTNVPEPLCRCLALRSQTQVLPVAAVRLAGLAEQQAPPLLAELLEAGAVELPGRQSEP